MKRITKLSIIMLLIIFGLTVNVYAKPSCTISMQTDQKEVKKGTEFTIDVNLSNIQSERGIIAIEATLEYDKDCLTLSKMEGQNSWDTPIEGLSYNEANGKLVIDKKGLAKSDETILKITFVVNETSKKDSTVSLKNITVADGTVPAVISDVAINVTIKDNENNPDTNPNPNPGEGQKPDINPNPDEVQTPDTTTSEDQKTNTNQSVENNNNKDNTATGRLPQTGKDNKNILLIVIAVLILIAIVFTFIYKSRQSNKNIRR